MATLRTARLPGFKIENKEGKEKPTGVKAVDVLNYMLSLRVIASSVDKRLGGDGRIWVLGKAQDESGRKSTGEGQFHLPRYKPEREIK